MVEQKTLTTTDSVLRLTLKENESVDIEGPITIIANRKADLFFKGPGKIGRRFFSKGDDNDPE